MVETRNPLRRCRTCLFFILLSAAGLANGAEPDSALLLIDSLFAENIEDAEKVILVLHKGRPGGRMATGSRLNIYSSREYNRDATWNQRVAKNIADRHSLRYLTDWWMSEIDVNCAVLRIEDDVTVDEVIVELLNDPQVVSAQPLTLFSTLAKPPNDPYFELQSAAGYFDLTAMHSHTTGKNILIAVVDTGIEIRHQDLAGQIVSSRNFVRDVSPGFADDLHGTAIAGVIAAHANNKIGIVGISPGAKIAGLKACWPLEAGKLGAICNSFTLALAINQAIADGVNIINLSLSGPPDEIVAMLIDEALAQGIVVVAATWENTPLSISFPASIPGVIAVTNQGINTWRSIDKPVFAPSDNILTTLPDNSYNFVSGTSLGAAQIAGYIALLLQENPTLSSTDIQQRLIDINNRNVTRALQTGKGAVAEQSSNKTSDVISDDSSNESSVDKSTQIFPPIL